MIDTPTADMLATVAGVAAVVALLMNLVVRAALQPPARFDAWAPAIAIVLGIVFAFLGELARGESRWVDALLVGIFAGALSQNANTLITRTNAAIRGTPPA